jgi:D-serine deaminase-like pyridoxal phosphate-dependent protein
VWSPHVEQGNPTPGRELADISTPALILDLDVLEKNIARMQNLVSGSGLKLRPHAKTHKSLEVARRQLSAGAVGVTVGTLGEAEVFADGGVDDIFVAYPLVVAGEKARRLRALHERVSLRVGVDSAEGARTLAAATAGTAPLDVLVECDSGERRSGVPASQAAELAVAAAREGLHVAGVFTHGGHGYGPTPVRAEAGADELRVLAEAASELQRAGLEPTVLSAGATPTVAYSSAPPVTEQRPGTYVFNDGNQLAFSACDAADIALTVLTTVISDAAVPGQVIVDAGSKAIAREPNELIPGLGSLRELPGSNVHNVNDYHGFVQLSGAPDVCIGDRLHVVPNHVCPVVNLFERYYVVRRGEIVDIWPIEARAKSQ